MPAFSLPAFVRALLVWLLIIFVESAQGALRRALARPELDFAIRQVSVLISVVIIFAITWILMRWMRPGSRTAALAVGAMWLGLTLAFEVALGRALGLRLDQILVDYDVTRGGMMPLGLLAMALTPWIVQILQDRTRADGPRRPSA